MAGGRARTLAHMRTRKVGAIGAVALAFGLCPGAAGAATFAVDKTADDGGGGACTNAPNDCSLRSAVQKVNAAAGDDTITLQGQTYTLDSVLPNLTGSDTTTLSGASARATVIDGHATAAEALNAANADLTLRDLSLRGFKVADAGAVLRADDGGLQLTRVAILDNQASGIAVNGAGQLTLVDSLVARNDSALLGGVATTGAGLTQIVRSTIADNIGRGYDLGSGAKLAYTGGLLTACRVYLYDSTVARNRATGDVSFGGNLADIQIGSSTCTPVIRASNTLIAGGRFNDAPQNCGIDVGSLGHNLDTDGSCGLDAGTDRTVADAGLGALGDHGGPTDTVELLEGSPAIDAGGGCGPVDQRGAARPLGGGCDIGAFESPFTAPPVVSAPAPASASSTVTVPATTTPPATTPPADTTAPGLTVSGVAKKVRRSALRKGLKVRVGATEAVSVDATLLVAPRKVTFAVVPDLALATVSLGRGTGTRTLTLKPSRKVGGRKAVPALLRIVATDAAGNRAARTIRFTVT